MDQPKYMNNIKPKYLKGKNKKGRVLNREKMEDKDLDNYMLKGCSVWIGE